MAEWKDLKSRARSLTLSGLGKARDLGESAKLNLDLAGEEENRKGIYAEIGRRFVESRPEAPEGYGELYDQLAQTHARIAAAKARLEELKED